MIQAYQSHIKCTSNKTNMIDDSVIQEIIKYNEIDCKVLYEIILYLRKKN
jgi:hypothetical protein